MPENKFHKNSLKTEKNHKKFSSQIIVQNEHENLFYSSKLNATQMWKNWKYNKFVKLPNPVPVQMFHSKSHSMTLLKRTSDNYIATYIMLFVADVAQFFPCCTPKKPCLALFSFPLRNMQSGLFALSCLWSKKKVWIRFSKKLDIV